MTGPLAITEGGSRLQSSAESELAVALLKSGEAKPTSSDQRELVPAAPAPVEELLRMLRLRLDQVDTQSSWHSQGTRNTPEGVEQSPVSFAATDPGGCKVVLPKGSKEGLYLEQGLPTSQLVSIGMQASTAEGGRFTPGPVGNQGRGLGLDSVPPPQCAALPSTFEVSGMG